MNKNLKCELNVGKIKGSKYGYDENLDVTIELELRNKKDVGAVFSACGNIWGPRHFDVISCGQNSDEILNHWFKGDFVKLNIPQKELVNLISIWKTWHLNDLNPECEHQRLLIDYSERDKLLPKDFFIADNYEQIIKIKEFKKCPICKYQYGTKWLFRKLPIDVETFLTKIINKYSTNSFI